MNNSNSLVTQYLDRPGGRVAFDLTGPEQGPLVICLPGMGDVRSTFRHLRTTMAQAGYRVACLDLRGHGDSDATFGTGPGQYDDTAAATDALALAHQLRRPAVLVGNSMGAGAAVIAAAFEPAMVRALVLVGPFIRNPPTPAAARLAMRAAMAGPWSTRVWLSYLPSLYPTRRDAEFRAHRAEIAASMRRPGHAAAFRQTTRTDHTPAWQLAGTVRQPTLVVMGDKDPDFPEPAAEAHLVADTLGGEVVMVPGAGHYPQAEFPEVTGPAVTQFLRQAAPHA
jgi:pimeloyl-ACP methyl ester carboxylesterase